MVVIGVTFFRLPAVKITGGVPEFVFTAETSILEDPELTELVVMGSVEGAREAICTCPPVTVFKATGREIVFTLLDPIVLTYCFSTPWKI